MVGNAEEASPYGCRPGGRCVSASLKGSAFVETEVGAAVSACGHGKAAGGLLHSSTEESGSWYWCPSAVRRGQRSWHWPWHSGSSCDLSNLSIYADPPARFVSGCGPACERARAASGPPAGGT